MATESKWTFDKRFERGKDFLRYLKTENVNVNGKIVQELKDLYNKYYQKYRLQVNPEEGTVNFMSVFQTLQSRNQIHMLNHKVYLGPPKTPPPNSAGDSPSGASISTQVYYGRQPPLRIAVDQFLTQPGPVPSPDPGGATSLPSSSDKSIKVTKSKADTPKPINALDCEICKVRCFRQTEFESHLNGKRHRAKSLGVALKNKRPAVTSNKFGVVITAKIGGQESIITAEVVNVEMDRNVGSDITFTIYNKSCSDGIRLVHCEMLKRCRVFSLHDHFGVTEGQKHVLILKGSSYEIHVKAKPGHFGAFHSPIAFQFRPDKELGNFNFHIVRFVAAKYVDAVSKELKPKHPYTRPPLVSSHIDRDMETVDGVRPERFEHNALETKIPLDNSHVSGHIRKLINRGLNKDKTNKLSQAEVVELDSLTTMLDSPITMDDYVKRFTLLLNCEEVQCEVDIRRYDMQDVTMKYGNKSKSQLLLEVPGLAEKRPSVLKGDQIYVRIRGEDGPGGKEYRGYVHEVHQNDVSLGFHQSLLQKFVSNMKFNVRFTVNRFPLKMQHRSVKLAYELSLTDLLFPTTKTACSRPAIIPLDEPLKFLYNQKIGANPQQFQAVKSILSGVSRPAPYIIFGPPGTGKTVTMVEAMKQVVRCIPTAHILACAPSNSAADLITERLIEHLSKAEVFRMMASSRPIRVVPELIKGVCNFNNNTGQFYFPTKSEIMKYKVVVCTLVTSGRIVSANFPSDHFTHVFIDEAGNACEPECIIPVAGVLDCLPEIKDGGQLVLAGDPKQLGAIIRSPIAVKYDLDMSMLERYMTDFEVYARRDPKAAKQLYDPRLITKLLKNYRSHPKILEKPNEMFYNGELIPSADPMLSQMFCKWQMLPKKDFPIIFHGVCGQDMREERSPSFFNPEEVSVVMTYVKELLSGNFPGVKVKQSYIGVISPYMKQVQKLRTMFAKNHWKDIKVGSVEEFQGDERNIIIVSTVRSQVDFLGIDVKFRLGFLDNPKRFNVALTRAKALLIVVGNPNILKGDPCWNSLLEFCYSNGGYTGADYQNDDDEVEDVIQRFDAVKLTEKSMDIEENSLHNDKPWRPDE